MMTVIDDILHEVLPWVVAGIVIIGICVAIAMGSMWLASSGEYKETITVKEKYQLFDMNIIVSENDNTKYLVNPHWESDVGMWNRMKINTTYVVTIDPTGRKIRGVNFNG